MRKLYTVTLFVVIMSGLRGQVVPNASISTNSTLFCTGIPVSLVAVPASTNSNLSYTWSIFPSKGIATSGSLNSGTVLVTFTSPALYNINLLASDGSTVTNSQKLLLINNSAKASFNATFNGTGYPTELVLTNYSHHSLNSYWRFSDLTDPDTSSNTVRVYNKSGNYTVTLIAEGVDNCNDTSSYSFNVAAASSITLPDIFTPNGDDANDVYRPITTGISKLNAWVFNRFGTLVASWNTVKGAWDGHTNSGEACAEGTYAVIVEATGFDGVEYKLKGLITLVR